MRSLCDVDTTLGSGISVVMLTPYLLSAAGVVLRMLAALVVRRGSATRPSSPFTSTPSRLEQRPADDRHVDCAVTLRTR